MALFDKLVAILKDEKDMHDEGDYEDADDVLEQNIITWINR